MKKLISAVVIILFITIMPLSTGAETKSDFMLSEESASVLAALFITDNVEYNPLTTWTEQTIISNAMEMTDTDGNPSAYSFELDTNEVYAGYIIVSAFYDVENYILEYSEALSPLYKKLSFNDQDTVIYTGGFGYFVDDGTDTLVSFDNDEVEKTGVESVLDEIRDESFAQDHSEIVALVKEALEDSGLEENALYLRTGTVRYDEYATSNKVEGATGDPYGYGIITDPIAFIDKVYGDGAGYKNYEYKSLESHCPHYTMAQFSDPYKPQIGNCAPTAITNLITMRANIGGISRVKNMYPDEIFSLAVNYGHDKGYYDKYNGGASPFTLDTFIKGTFNECGITVTVSSDSKVTYDKIKTEINANRPFYLSINYGYGFAYAKDASHGVAVYAYTRFKNSSNNGVKSFIKIADGWSNQGRYMDVKTLEDGRTIMRKIY